ncbi:MAG: glycoside hydrolase family 16 protein [Erythrobacter sp.]|uniref:glycoside hydrolase family 16 protein n=1 Tax=Erythrobacter sp. TaxID=1042 RepID=UPI00326479E4
MGRRVSLSLVAGLGIAGLGIAGPGIGGLVSSVAAQDASPATQVSVADQEAATIDALPRVETSVPAGFELVWSDEFDAPGLPDPTKWKYDTFRNEKGWFNNEKQYYAEGRLENSRVENGNLIIEARQEDLAPGRFPDWSGQEYSSARLLTQGLGDWTFGFFEIRAKLPCGTGTWPAIWMLPSEPDIEWPAGGEIDIMEHVGFEPGIIHHSIHTTAFNFSRGTQKTSKHELPTACDAMHKYQLLWAPNMLLFAVDDQPKFLFQKESDKKTRWPFDKPQHLLLNVAVGGTWGGQKGIDPSAFPARMEVDYVRVFQPTNLIGQQEQASSK